MKKNGFIATSLLFSFFVIFLTLSIMILASYSQYQTSISTLNNNILKDLNNSVILDKYTTIYNSVTDGDVSSIERGSFNWGAWSLQVNANPFYDSENKSSYIKLTSNGYRFAQYIKNGKYLSLSKNGSDVRKIYVRYNIFRKGSVLCNSSSVSLRIGTNTQVMSGNLCGDYVNWEMRSQIFCFVVNSQDQEIKFEAAGIHTAASYIPLSEIYTGF